MSVLDDYRENYDRIAEDHIRHWRETGGNPFQSERAIAENQRHTEALVRRYSDLGDRVLDAGCGMGDLLLRLRDDYDVAGAEIARPYLEVLRERGLPHEWCDVEALSFRPASFDVVVATDVLEHVLDLHRATKGLLRVLKRGGHVVVRVPNEDPVSWDDESNRGYRFVHLRILDEGTMRVLFSRIFNCEIREAYVSGDSIHLCARKC